MMTLEDAWDWYQKTESLLYLIGRLGFKHWDNLESKSGSFEKDDRFKAFAGDAIGNNSQFCLEHLDDFAVLILFSVFESIVRERTISEIHPERQRLEHPILIRMADDAIEAVENGPIFRVLELYKGRDADLVEEVNQVRKYRNWVAHGRKSVKPDAVDPVTAHDRLKRFLDGMDDPA